VTTIITGRDLSLSIDEDDYDAQASTVTLTQELNRATYELISGRVRKVLDEDGELTVTMMSDWGEAESLCAALWTAADESPDTSLEFTFMANGDEFEGKCFPVKPDVTGEGNEASTVTITMVLDGPVAYTAATPPTP
jgi:hypothetical protein